MQTGERMFNLKRAFNNRCGITSKDDTIPKRLLQAQTTGSAAGYAPDLETMLKDYYNVRGWDASGKPSKKKLLELGLTKAAKELWKE